VNLLSSDRCPMTTRLCCGFFVAVILFASVFEVIGFSLWRNSHEQSPRAVAWINKRSTLGHLSDAHLDDDLTVSPPMELPGEEYLSYDSDDLASLTVIQLKQQLRLRGLPLSGRKSELINRLLNRGTFEIGEPKIDVLPTPSEQLEPVQQVAGEKGKEMIDVQEYLDQSDRGRSVKSSSPSNFLVEDFEGDSATEVWGAEARLSTSGGDDDRRLIVDSISRTVLEFKGSNQTFVKAVVVATREALKPYLRGGSSGRNTTIPITTAQATEQRLLEIQLKREREAAAHSRFDTTEGLDEGDETGIFENVLRREVADWGKYTVTGAQLSAQEIKGVLLLTDVYGAFTADTTALAEKIAFECQPVVVMIPDLFRGDPWTGESMDVTNEKGQTYEEWRITHNDLRVSIDIRAAAACLRETYGVSSVVVWGTCFGGGRALEAASGWCESVHDVDGTTVGPPPVEPMVVVAWYPTRYNASALFGIHHRGRKVSLLSGSKPRFALMGVFAGNDSIPGATSEDAAALKQLLEEDDRVVDHMIKVFPQQSHGFAHLGLGQPQQYQNEIQQYADEEFLGAGRLDVIDGEAGVASLLSTAFMETYSRVFLPTVGPPICSDEEEQEWGRELNIGDLRKKQNRNIREELKNLNKNFVEEPLMSGPRIDPTDTSDEEALVKLLRSTQSPDFEGPYKILDDDDLPTIYKKLLSSDENFQIF
jgi:dienelactone hydrolase